MRLWCRWARKSLLTIAVAGSGGGSSGSGMVSPPGGWGGGIRTVVAVVGLAEHRREPPRDRQPSTTANPNAMPPTPAALPGRDVDDDRDQAAEHHEHADPRGRAPPVAVPADEADDRARNCCEQAAHEHALVAAEHDRADDRLRSRRPRRTEWPRLLAAPVEHGADAEEHDAR